MDIRKYIIFLIAMLLLPLLGYAQKVGGKYIVTTNDTTQIVSGRGMKDPENTFLLKKNLPGADSVYANMRSDYNSLEAATLDIDKLIGEIENDQTLLKTGNVGLGYRLSKINVDNLEKEKKAKVLADSIQQEMMKKSADELAQRYAYYGDKPSYFINEVQVSPDLIGRLTHGDIIERKMDIQNTGSGNPNGEVRITITDKAARKIGVPELFGGEIDNGFRGRSASASDVAPSSNAVETREYTQPQPVVSDTKKDDTRTPAVEKNKPEKEKSPKRSVRRIKSDRENKKEDKEESEVRQPVYQPAPVQTKRETQPAQVMAQPEAKEPAKAQQSQNVVGEQTKATETSQPKQETSVQSKAENTSSVPAERRTIVRSRTVNNVEVEVNEPVDGTGSPQN